MSDLLLTRMLNEPLLAHPAKALTVANVLLRRAGRGEVAPVDFEVGPEFTATNPHIVSLPTAIGLAAGPAQSDKLRQQVGANAPFLFKDGIAVIEVTGSLAHRRMNAGKSSGVLGYDWITAQLNAALEAPEVRGIIFDIHSGGGEVSGAFTLGDEIFAARQQKPVLALADEMAFSAAYVIAAACDEVWLASDTAQVGSVGVVMVHMSFQDQLAMEGIKPTIIQAGEKKADGNPFEDLPERVAADLQEKIDSVFDVFVQRVATWRGMAAGDVVGLQADTFMGEQALSVGLADGIASPSEVFEAFAGFTSDAINLPALRTAT